MPQIAQVDARVPIELVDLVVVHLRPPDLTLPSSGEIPELQPNFADLLLCSLVCHQWRAVILGHLFYNITCGFQQESSRSVPNDQASDGGDTSKHGHPGHSHKTISLFCQFLENTPAVRGCIRQLKLVHRFKVSDERPNSDFSPEIHLDGQLFARLLRLCPRLDVLHLLGVFLGGVCVLHPSERRSLRVLKIMPCHGGLHQQDVPPPYKAGAEVVPIMFFSRIERLHLTTPVYDARRLATNIAFPAVEVRNLEVEKAGYGLNCLVSALRRSGALNSLRSLTITECNRHRAETMSHSFERLFTLISPTLERLDVRGIFRDIDNEYVAITLDLSRCSRLEVLFVGFSFDAEDVTGTIIRLLRSVSSKAPLGHLRITGRIRFRKGTRTLSEDQCAVFGPLDEVLAQMVEVHNTLPLVTVVMRVDGEYLPLESYVRSLLPKLESKGKLHVRVGYSLAIVGAIRRGTV